MGRLLQGLVDPSFASFAVVFFLVFFLAVVAWVFIPRRRAAYEMAAKLPLDEHSNDGAA